MAARDVDENSTAAKALHGGAISSLIDTTGAMAAWTTAEIATPKYFGSTDGINANYLSGAIGEDIFAERRVAQARERDHLLGRARHERCRQAAGAGIPSFIGSLSARSANRTMVRDAYPVDTCS